LEEVTLLLRGNPGTEDIMAMEAREELLALEIVEQRKASGRVVARVNPRLIERLYSMRSIHSASLLLDMAEGVPSSAEGLNFIFNRVYKSRAADYIPYAGSFAVRVTRHGDHAYTSIDIARVAGDAIIKSSMERRGFRPEVRLSSPSVSFTLDLIEDRMYLGVSLSGEESLHRRGVRIYDHPAALKPTLAYVMLRLSGARDGDMILDPMCGGGTVAIEAAHLFPTANIVCMDVNPLHVRGAILNALAARVYNRITFMVGDARRLDEIMEPGSVDVIVSNPPYGIRLGSPSEVRALYRSFIRTLPTVLRPGGRATLITTESTFVIKEAKRRGMLVTHIRKVRHGDLWATILILERQ